MLIAEIASVPCAKKHGAKQRGRESVFGLVSPASSIVNRARCPGEGRRDTLYEYGPSLASVSG